MSTALIDGDILLVKTGFALEKEVEWGEDVWTLTVNLQEWKDVFEKSVKGLMKDLMVSDYVVCISKGRTFRHDLYPDYKGNRKGRKPVGMAAMKDWVIEEHNGKCKEGIEADDSLGILTTHPTLIKGEKIVVSQDKDLKTIPCLLYQDGVDIEISEEEANYNHMLQTLTGDTVDGYLGCPGVGQKKAEKILSGQPSEHWDAVVEAYVSKGLTEEDALLQARLARILRYQDYDFKKKEVKLWKP